MSNVSLIDGHLDNAEHCVCCGRVIPENSQYCFFCGMKVKNGKQRQIDRIRNMSVEELAEFLANYVQNTVDKSPYEWQQYLESEVDTE